MLDTTGSDIRGSNTGKDTGASGDAAFPSGLIQAAANYSSDPTGEVYAFHPGGANVAMGDGSVRFINEKILIDIFAALVTRAGSEKSANIDAY